MSFSPIFYLVFIHTLILTRDCTGAWITDNLVWPQCGMILYMLPGSVSTRNWQSYSKLPLVQEWRSEAVDRSTAEIDSLHKRLISLMFWIVLWSKKIYSLKALWVRNAYHLDIYTFSCRTEELIWKEWGASLIKSMWCAEKKNLLPTRRRKIIGFYMSHKFWMAGNICNNVISPLSQNYSIVQVLLCYI